MTAQTTTQRTAKHRLAVKERMARHERALREIVETAARESVTKGDFARGVDAAWKVASSMALEALNPTDPAKS